MKNRSLLMDVLDRADGGPIVEEKEFDRVLVCKGIAELVTRHDIRIPKTPFVPCDDDLADRVFEAGMELAVSAGLYCTNTNRRIVFSRAEVERRLNDFPGQITLGEGEDACTVHWRRPDDNGRIGIVGGAYGTPVPEELFVPIMLSYAQEPVVDWIDNATMSTVYRRAVRGGTYWEMLSCWEEADKSFEVLRRAGRPGLAIGCAEASTSDLGELTTATAIGGFRPIDWHHACLSSELKTSYDQLNKVVHFTRTGCHIHSFYNPIYGGLVGGREGMAVAIVAGMIMMELAHLASTVNVGPTHMRYNCSTHPDMMAGIAVALQAVTRNAKLLTSVFMRPASGPGTKTILYETAALALAAASSGSAFIEGVQSATGIHEGHCSGLEARFVGEVCRASCGMPRGQANGIAQALVARYAAIFDAPPIGRPFPEVYNLKTLKPSPEWEGMYEDVKGELRELGLPIR